MDDLRELIAERAAIMEYDAGIPREEAELLAVDSVAEWLAEAEVPNPPASRRDR